MIVGEREGSSQSDRRCGNERSEFDQFHINARSSRGVVNLTQGHRMIAEVSGWRVRRGQCGKTAKEEEAERNLGLVS
jgi:hypothetical protein